MLGAPQLASFSGIRILSPEGHAQRSCCRPQTRRQQVTGTQACPIQCQTICNQVRANRRTHLVRSDLKLRQRPPRNFQRVNTEVNLAIARQLRRGGAGSHLAE